MSDTSLNATTDRKLHTFGRRRRSFAGIRGGLTAVAILLVVFAIIVTIDWLSVMSNPVRWALTLGGYLLAAVGSWRMGLAEFLTSASREDIAKSMESAAPQLREEVLSAVELADFDPQSVRDSVEFRELVQQSVAEQIAEVQPTELLPWRRLRRFAVAAGSGLILVATLAAVVGFGFATRLFMRAAVPGANIARVGGVEIEILQPAPASLIVRAGDSVPLRFQVSKPEVHVAQLTLKSEGRPKTLQLRPVEPGIFETTVQTNRSLIEYSLSAGDAATSTYQIDPHTPPVILDFNKRYAFPSYLGREAQEIRERDGHLKAIEGTRVRLEITTDQPSVGEISLSTGGEIKTINLTAEENLLTAEIPIDDSGRYQVHLSGARSGLPSEFAPTYQITAHPDKAPRIRLIKPDAQRVVQPDAVVPILAQAEDDFGIESVQQWLSRNGTDQWEKFPVVISAGRQTPIAFNWDLLKHHLEAGDLVTTKLVAFDGRGETAESREVQLMVNFRDLDPERLSDLRARQRALSVLDQLNENSSSTLTAFRNVLNDGPPDLTKLYELDREAWSAMGRLKSPLQTVSPGRDAYDMNLAARSAAIGRHLGIRLAIRRAGFARKLRDPEARKAHVASIASDASAAMRRYSAARELVRSMIAEELPRVALGDFLDLRRQTELLLPAEDGTLMSSQNDAAQPDERGNPPEADQMRRFGRVLGLTLHRASAIIDALAKFEVSWRNQHAEKLHRVAQTIGPRLESLALDLESLRDDDRRSHSAINELGSWWQLGGIPFVDFETTYHHQYAPELAIELGKPVEGKRWTKVADWQEGAHRELAPEGTLVYLFRTITTAKENEVHAEITCREGVTIWLNGKVWVQNHNVRTRDTQRYRMTLRPGQNNLLVKLVNRRHRHPFSFRIENGRLEGNVDLLATTADKIQFLTRQTKRVLDDAIGQLQPVLIQMSENTAQRRMDNQREAEESRAHAVALQRLVGRSIYHGIGIEGGKAFPALQRDYLNEISEMRWIPFTDTLDSFAWLDEIRPDSDRAFCRATGLVARALESMQSDFEAAAKAKPQDYPEDSRYSPATQARRELDDRMKRVSEEFLVLERAFEVREVASAIRELASQEQWRSQGAQPRTRHPFQWQWAVERLESVALKLSQESAATEAGTELLTVLSSAPVDQVSEQMKRRLTTLEPAGDVQKQLGLLHSRLGRIIDDMSQRETDALVAIGAEAPSMIELLATAERSTRDLSTRTRRSVAELAEADQTVAFARTRRLFLAGQQNERDIRNAMNALRQDANSQNILLQAGRDRSRDTDVALQWLREPTKLSAAAFEDALFAESPRDQRHFLEDGGLSQGELANRLEALKKHFQALDSGGATSPLRDDLRALEIELDLREQLDREYSQLQRVASMAQLDDTSKLIGALETEMTGNDAMHRELDTLSRNAAQDALTLLQQAARSATNIQQSLHKEAARQGEFHPEMTKAELQDAIPTSEDKVDRLRDTASKIWESYRSLLAQQQQLKQHHEDFEKAKTDFLEFELPLVAPKLSESADNLSGVTEALRQASDLAQQKLQTENSDLAALDLTDEVAALRARVIELGTTLSNYSSIPSAAAEPFQEAKRYAQLAIERFPIAHRGDLRIANQLYQRANDLRNAVSQLEAASDATLNADRNVIAAEMRPAGKELNELRSLVKLLHTLADTSVPAAMKLAREVGATDAETNFSLSMKELSAAKELAPKNNASLLELSKSLDQVGTRLRESGVEMMRGSRTVSVQVSGPAKVRYNVTRQTIDSIRRLESQVRQQQTLQSRAMAAIRPRGRQTIPEDLKKAKLAEAEAAGKLAEELSRQAKRLTEEHRGKVEKAKAALDQITEATNTCGDCGKQAQKIGDQFRKLADSFEEQVNSLQPRADSELGRMARRITDQLDSINELADQIEDLALRIHPNLHSPSETEVVSRQIDEAIEKVQELVASEIQLREGPHPDELLPQITAAQSKDSATRNELAQAEQNLRRLQAIDALPPPQPNPQRAAKAISSAADEQAQIISQVASSSDTLLRAVHHERRLGKSSGAEALQQIATRVFNLAKMSLPGLADDMRNAKRATDGNQIAETFDDAIRAEIDTLRAFLFPEANVASQTAQSGDQPSAPTELLTEREAEVSRQLARILFQLQKQVSGDNLLAQLDPNKSGTRANVERDFEESISAEPENTPTEPENTPTETENTPTETENTPTEPENTPTEPENTPTEPENTPTETENTPTETENTPTETENTPTETENTPTETENTPTEPENTPTEPENTPTELENTPTEPENTPTEPENTPTEPENTPTEPENTPTEPENTPTEPENTPTEPENTPTEPENTPTEPENTPTEPENTPTEPENTPTEPENTPTEPENTPTEPENTPTEPENTPTEPENTPTEPENTPTEPENATQPTVVTEPLPITPELAEAIQDVVEAQTDALNELRNVEAYALPAVELDETVIERDSFSDDLDRLAHLRDRNWNMFREETESDLSLGTDDAIDGIYRDAIEAYFRVISRNSEAPELRDADER